MSKSLSYEYPTLNPYCVPEKSGPLCKSGVQVLWELIWVRALVIVEGFRGRCPEQETGDGENSSVLFLHAGLGTGIWTFRKKYLQMEAERNILWQTAWDTGFWSELLVFRRHRERMGIEPMPCRDITYMAQWAPLLHQKEDLAERLQTSSKSWWGLCQGTWDFVWTGQR